MNNQNILFQTIDWSTIPKNEHLGENGKAFWQTVQFEGLRVRIVEYSKGYIADHWCKKGHIVHCLEGEFISELESGEKYKLIKGMTYIVSDNLSSHRSLTENGVKLMIIDGNFLKRKNIINYNIYRQSHLIAYNRGYLVTLFSGVSPKFCTSFGRQVNSERYVTLLGSSFIVSLAAPSCQQSVKPGSKDKLPGFFDNGERATEERILCISTARFRSMNMKKAAIIVMGLTLSVSLAFTQSQARETPLRDSRGGFRVEV